MIRQTFRLRVLVLLAALVAPALLRADAPSNVPQFCSFQTRKCTTCHGDIANECVLLSLDLGETTPWTGSMPVHLKVRTSEASPSLSTPSQLKLVLGYTFMHLGPETSGDEGGNAATFSDEAGRSMEFRFESGSSVGVPRFVMGGDAQARLQMVDAEGWATLSNPAFFDLYPGDGSVWRYVASPVAVDFGSLVRYVNPRGAAYTWDDMGVAVLRDASGFLRQVATRTRLADIVVHSATHYTVTVYPLTEDPQTDPDTGLLVPPPHDPVRVLDVRRGTTDRELIVGYQKGTGDMRTYRYVAKNGDWELTNPSGLVDANELYFTEDENGARRIHVWKDSDGTPLRRMEANFIDAPWGWAMTNFVEGIPGDATRTTSWSYFESGPHQGLVQEQITPTGNRIAYEYDAQNRVVRESMPLVEEETLYSYEPVDPSDPPLLCDTRPRCVVRKMQGVEIQRTYYVYGTNGVDVVERVGEQGAAYGGTNVLRTVTTYYPVTGAVTDGLVKSVRHEDGTIDNYAYGLTDGVWTETITHVHEQAPDIVPMRTTRSVRVFNALGQLVDSRTDLCTIGVEDLVPQADWTPIERLQYAYDVDGNEIRREDLAGRLWTAEWAGSCCGKVSETDWQGITTTYAYDAEGRVEIEKLVNSSKTETNYTYDPLGKVVESYLTNRVEEIGSAPVRKQYDSLGRTVGETDLNGNWVSTRFDSGETHLTTVYPSSYTNELFLAPDWKPIRRVATKTASEFHSYGVSENGLSWHRIVYGNPTNHCFIKEFKNLLRQTVRVERSGSNNSTLVEEREFDQWGRLSCLSQSDAPESFFSSDPLGFSWFRERTFGGVRRFESLERSFQVRDGAIWELFVEEKSSSDTSAPLQRIRRTQLTNLSRGTIKNAETIDRRGNVSRVWKALDRENGTLSEFASTPGTDVTTENILRFGLLVTAVDGLGATNRWEYDGLARPVVMHDAFGREEKTSFDPWGKPMTRTTFSGHMESYEYDPFGRLACMASDTGASIRYEYDEKGRVGHRWGTVSPKWYEFDDFDRLASLSTVRTEGGTADTTRWFYDIGSGVPIKKQFADGTEIQRTLNPDGTVSARTNARGITTSFHYDGWGNLIGIDYSDDTPDVTFQRDGFGRLSKVVTENVSTNEFVYDQFGDLVRELQNGVAFDRVRDAFGRETSISIGGTPFCEIAYDGVGRISTIESIPAGRFNYGWRGPTWFVESMSTDFGAGWTRMFDSLTDFAETFVQNRPNGISATFYYGQDARGNIIRSLEQVEDSETAWSYCYDSFDELTNAVSVTLQESFQFDLAGNRVSERTGTHQLLHEIDSVNHRTASRNPLDNTSVSLAWDADGNLLCSGNGWNYAWDAENRLTRMWSDETDIAFFYDYMGRVVRRTETPSAAPEETKSIRFVWDIINPVQMTTSQSNTESSVRFLWGLDRSGSRWGAGGIGGLLCQIDETTVYYPSMDGRGNIRAYFTPDGAIVSAKEFDPFGETIQSIGGVARFPFWWQSKEQMDNGLIAYQFRIYSPEFGFWLSRDPIEENEGVNLHSAFGNNPISNHDFCGFVDAIDPSDVEKAKKENKPASDTECVYIYFYDTEMPRIYDWEDNSDNNWISHVAIQVGESGTNNIVGFNREPKSKNETALIYNEDRLDIALIWQCCCFTSEQIQRIKNFLTAHVGKPNFNGEDWGINHPNCATFVVEALRSALGEYSNLSPNWDLRWWISYLNFDSDKTAQRPEEVRRLLETIAGCSQIYTNRTWKGKIGTENKK